MSIFTGAGVALVTPFKEDLSVDYDQLEKFIDFQIDNGTDSIVICGLQERLLQCLMTTDRSSQCMCFSCQ